MYVIDVEPIPPRNRNYRKVHPDYLKHLKESVATFREIEKEAKVEKPFDSSLTSACRYTKYSQELAEYVIGTFSNNFNKEDKQIASTPVTRKKQVTFMDPCCSKHMTGDRSPLRNFVKKFIETVRIGNDHFGAIMGYGDYVIGDSVISRQIQVSLNKTVRYIRTDNGTEFVNQILTEYYENVSIFHQKSVSRTPQQNGVVERRNRTLVEAVQIMLIFSKALMFLWTEAVATACYSQNRSLIHTRHNKTPYELVYAKKPDLTFFRVFGLLCYPTNDSEDLEKIQPTTDIEIFVGYAPSRKGYRIYSK
nr:integrase, catalytic region, zinc finger, CCHC-type, peptidase aspartic, catalytic [Tanacetum cinerariifolium]